VIPSQEERQRKEHFEKSGRHVTVAKNGHSSDIEMAVFGVQPPVPGEAILVALLAFRSRGFGSLWNGSTNSCALLTLFAGEALNAAQLEFIKERERRTAVHPKHKW
jgi:hypothetical protein